NNLIVAGPGNEDVLAGVTTNVQPGASWHVTGNSTTGFVLNDVGFVGDPYTVPAGVTYEGNLDRPSNGVPVGIGNDTIFGGKGNDVIQLSNGNNYVDVGDGNA